MWWAPPAGQPLQVHFNALFDMQSVLAKPCTATRASPALSYPRCHRLPFQVVNNAGIIRRTGLDDVTPADMLDCFITNAMGPLFVTQQLHKHGLIGQPGTLLANMTSKARESVGGHSHSKEQGVQRAVGSGRRLGDGSEQWVGR